MKSLKTPLLFGLFILVCLLVLTTCKPPDFDDLPEVEWVITEVYKTSDGARVWFTKIGETSYTASHYFSDIDCKNYLDVNQLVLINGQPITDRQSVQGGGGVSGVRFAVLTSMPINEGDIMYFKGDWFFVRDSGSWAGTAGKWKVRIITPSIVITPQRTSGD